MRRYCATDVDGLVKLAAGEQVVLAGVVAASEDEDDLMKLIGRKILKHFLEFSEGTGSSVKDFCIFNNLIASGIVNEYVHTEKSTVF